MTTIQAESLYTQPPPTAQTTAASPFSGLARPANVTSGQEALHDAAMRKAETNSMLHTLEEECVPLAKEFERLREKLNKLTPTITFVGQVKSGKTTLVNAFAGFPDLLPTDVNPWTSVVTSLRIDPQKPPGTSSARFTFMTQQDWALLQKQGGRMGEIAGRAGAEHELTQVREQVLNLRERAKRRLGQQFELLMGQAHDYGYFDKNLIERYICLGDEQHPNHTSAHLGQAQQGRFTDITRSAELEIGDGIFPVSLCLRDTPGVNDTFLVREQITLQSLQGSQTSVVVLNACQALTSADLGLLRMISNLDAARVIIFVNRIDELACPGEQIPEIEENIRATLAQHEVHGDVQIISGSAHWASVSLSGDLETMHPASAESLGNWAQHQSTSLCDNLGNTEFLWQLSGLPSLNQAISQSVAEHEMDPVVNEIQATVAALNAAQQAGRALQQRSDPATTEVPSPRHRVPEMRARFDQDRVTYREQIDALLDSFAKRAERAHLNFADRATHTLLLHLEQYGDQAPWEYDPAGLRLLLRGAYTVLCRRVEQTLQTQHAAISAVAADHWSAYIEDLPPDVFAMVFRAPDLPPPVALAQTIALDLRDSWWLSLWRRTRGYAAFASQFRDLICAESETLVDQLVSDQAEAIRRIAYDKIDEMVAHQSSLSDALVGSPS